MALFGLTAYLQNVIPGCVGAGRADRIPGYLRRSLLLTAGCMLPLLALQFAASPIMAAAGVPPPIAEQVGVYPLPRVTGPSKRALTALRLPSLKPSRWARTAA
jgi:hypothetical protein